MQMMMMGTPSGGSASGGNIDGLEPGNGYKYHVFTASGALTVTGTLKDLEVVAVGGGGGGGYSPTAPPRPQADGTDTKFGPGTPVAVESGGGGSGGGGNNKWGASGVWARSPDQTAKVGSR